jgi:RNA polymerase sigma-70 factor (ECF subfamily)
VNPPQTTKGDLELMLRISRRDREAFAELYDRYAEILYGVALRTLDETQEAGEVVHHVFVYVWKNSKLYTSELGKPLSWLLSLTRNRAIEQLKARKGSYRFLHDITPDAVNASNESSVDSALDYTESRLIRSSVETVPLEQRQAIELAFLGGMTQTQIAEQLRQPPATIRARIRRGLVKLRHELKEML